MNRNLKRLIRGVRLGLNVALPIVCFLADAASCLLWQARAEV